MRWSRSWPVVVALAVLGSSLVAHAAPPKKKPPPTSEDELPPAQQISRCAVVRAEARMEAYGFSHVVVLENGCGVPVSCEVWTDVDPSPRASLDAPPGGRAEVLSRRGSPSRDVTAFKECRQR
jgi:hypothetical protein